MENVAVAAPEIPPNQEAPKRTEESRIETRAREAFEQAAGIRLRKGQLVRLEGMDDMYPAGANWKIMGFAGSKNVGTIYMFIAAEDPEIKGVDLNDIKNGLIKLSRVPTPE
ncbi:MAG: hypothetical protein HY983_01090 [Candidatus Magasanikbacteria bacterium]|nr:hypothetical protein [Candidatus Magasanikbacteria bacterium]